MSSIHLLRICPHQRWRNNGTAKLLIHARLPQVGDLICLNPLEAADSSPFCPASKHYVETAQEHPGGPRHTRTTEPIPLVRHVSILSLRYSLNSDCVLLTLPSAGFPARSNAAP